MENQTIKWLKHQQKWSIRGIDLEWSEETPYLDIIAQYKRAYQPAILKSLVILLQPMHFFNTVQFVPFFDNPSTTKVLTIVRKLPDVQIERFQGFINSILVLVQILSRFYFLVNNIILFYFRNNVQMIRVHNFMNTEFLLFNKFKNIYHRYTLLSTIYLLLIVMLGITVLLNEFEGKINSLKGLNELVYYVVISMTSVGYGDVHAISVPGRVSVVISVFSGISLVGCFMVALFKFLEFDENQSRAYNLIARDKANKIRKKQCTQMLIIQCKIRGFNKQLAQAIKNNDLNA